MLSRFASDVIVPEEFKLPSFNHVLLQRRDTKMYQVIFLLSLYCVSYLMNVAKKENFALDEAEFALYVSLSP